MDKQWDYKRCIAVLSQEIALLGKVYSIQSAVREAVLRKEWIDFDWKIAEIKQTGRELAELDLQRAALFSALANTGELPPFYTLVARLPENERMELSRLYRLIKMETLKMQVLNESFIAYLNESKTMAKAYLETVFPMRGGKLYNHKGGQKDQDFKSMVFNRQI